MCEQLESGIEALEKFKYKRIDAISWRQKQRQKFLEDRMKRELTTEKNRKVKYFGHIKSHTTFMKAILEGKL